VRRVELADHPVLHQEGRHHPQAGLPGALHPAEVRLLVQQAVRRGPVAEGRPAVLGGGDRVGAADQRLEQRAGGEGAVGGAAREGVLDAAGGERRAAAQVPAEGHARGQVRVRVDQPDQVAVRVHPGRRGARDPGGDVGQVGAAGGRGQRHLGGTGGQPAEPGAELLAGGGAAHREPPVDARPGRGDRPVGTIAPAVPGEHGAEHAEVQLVARVVDDHVAPERGGLQAQRRRGGEGGRDPVADDRGAHVVVGRGAAAEQLHGDAAPVEVVGGGRGRECGGGGDPQHGLLRARPGRRTGGDKRDGEQRGGSSRRHDPDPAHHRSSEPPR
jgi:hypothetical protein